ncbi:MAG: carbamoyl phosphate synthase large subunit, partial [Actinomycetota bacterium]|nr:carbamoyl phosphate synthase large subunit [Actinomycetota bacterium]
LEDAIEIDVDAVYDGEELYVGGVLEHIEEAGIHSGDSACVIPPYTLGKGHLATVRSYVEAIARALGVQGFLNVQLAFKDDVLFVIEANPRASRTVPFISKATGVPLAKVAARVMIGDRIADLRSPSQDPTHPEPPLLPAVDATTGLRLDHVAVKEAVLPFDRFPEVDSVLGPEMRSTGEVMGIDTSFGAAFAKSQAGTGKMVLPTRGTVFVSVANRDKRAIVFPVKRLVDLGFDILATEGTAEVLQRAGVPAAFVAKVSDGPTGEPHVVDLIAGGRVDLVLNTPFGRGPRSDGYLIRTSAVAHGVPCITTMSGILAAIQGIESLQHGRLEVGSLQEYHRRVTGDVHPIPISPSSSSSSASS